MHRLFRHFAVIRYLFILDASSSEVHQDLIHGQPMQPRRESGITAKTSCFTEKLYENFLRQILCLRSVIRHAHRQAKGPSMIPLINNFESSQISISGELTQLK